MTIKAALEDSIKKLTSANISTARLDTLVLLADELKKDKAWILAHLEQVLPATALKSLQKKITLRAQRQPIAYIRGTQEFYGRDFKVNSDVLIPRPDSEALIDILKTLAKKTPGLAIDVGTGCGALGITAALECPDLQMQLSDVSPQALKVAEQNAANHKLDLPLHTGSLLNDFTEPTFTYIVANLPYVDRIWERSAETNYEPSLALFADDSGLALIKKLIQQAPQALKPKGYLLLEADPRQHAAICQFAKTFGFTPVEQQAFTVVLQLKP